MVARKMNTALGMVLFAMACMAVAELGHLCESFQKDSVLRLRGGTGQGGPSRGFRSNGKSFKWRHPMTMFARAHAHKRPPTVSSNHVALRIICCEYEWFI